MNQKTPEQQQKLIEKRRCGGGPVEEGLSIVMSRRWSSKEMRAMTLADTLSHDDHRKEAVAVKVSLGMKPRAVV